MDTPKKEEVQMDEMKRPWRKPDVLGVRPRGPAGASYSFSLQRSVFLFTNSSFHRKIIVPTKDSTE